MDNLIGKILEERYRIGELIGTGGMANVYKATDLIDGTVVAVKILREECRSNSELVRRFKNESKAISVLDHPNIVKVFDFSMTEKIQYIIMEYIDGITLKEYMEYRGQPLTYKETLHFITQVLAALQHAHDRGIVHRDIKPQNIMLLSDSSIKVMDFGIARFSRSENQTMTDKAIGSVHYISPEQARGGATDAKADLYSVGVMMYEMLSGRLPFESDSPVSVAIKQISDTATPLRELNPAVPEALASITERAMAKDPRERYPSAQAMLADIDEFKRNPSVKFEYQYLTDSAPTRYVDKVMSKTADKQQTAARRAAPSRSSAPKKSAAKKPKRRKRRLLLPILAGMAAAFLIGSSILVYWIFKEQSNGMFVQHKDVELPNFIGLSYEQIKEQYKESQFYFREEHKYNEQYPAGTVCDQYPRAQTADNPKIVKDNAVITLTVSKGVEIVSMPDLTGMTRAEAMNECRRIGLLPTFRSVQVPIGQSSGIVMSTEPLVGTSVEANTTNSKITVYISQQEVDKNVPVPNLVGMTSLEDAQTAIKAVMLELGTYTEEYSDTVPAGAIISQDPVEGSPARWHDLVSVVVSKGPEPRTRTITLTVTNRYKKDNPDFDIASQPYQCYFNGGLLGEWRYPEGAAGQQGTSWPVTSTGSGTAEIKWGGETIWSGSIDFGPAGTDAGHTDARGDTDKKPEKPEAGGDGTEGGGTEGGGTEGGGTGGGGTGGGGTEGGETGGGD